MGSVIYSLLFLVISPLILLLAYAACSHEKIKAEERILIFLCAPFIFPLFLSYSYQVGCGMSLGLILIAASLFIPVFFRKNFNRLIVLDAFSFIKEKPFTFKHLTKNEIFLSFILVFFFTLFCIQLFAIPLMEPDALEFNAVAKAIYERGNFTNYPFIKAEANGLFTPSSHPPGFIVTQITAFMVAGVKTTLPMRLLTLYMMIITSLLMIFTQPKSQKNIKIIILILFFSVPLWVSMATSLNTDAIRICLFFASLISTYFFINFFSHSPRFLFLTAFINSLAAFTHSIGLLAPLFSALFILLAQNLTLKIRIKALISLVIIGLVVTGSFYIKNIVLYGSPLQDSGAIIELPALHYLEEVYTRRGIEGLIGEIFNGLLMPFYQFFLFGAPFLFALISLFYWKKLPNHGRFALKIYLTYFGLMLILVLLGSNLGIKNPRYPLTLIPFAILLMGFLAYYFQKKYSLSFIYYGFLGLTLFFSLLGSATRMIGYHDINAVFKGEEQRILSKDRFIGGTILSYLNHQANDTARVLTFRHHEMSVYGQFTWLDHLDNAAIDIYQAKTTEDLFHVLKNKKIRFIYISHIMPSTAAHSNIANLIGDNRYATLIMSHRGARLYELNEAKRDLMCEPIDVSGIFSTKPVSFWQLFVSFTGLPQFLKFDTSHFSTLPTALTYEATRIAFVSGYIKLVAPLKTSHPIQMSLTFKGKGFFTLHEQTDAPTKQLLWEGLALNESRTISVMLSSANSHLALNSLPYSSLNLSLEKLTACHMVPRK